MKLTTMTQVSLDGVMQGNGGDTPDERARNGFERGGWARGHGDETTDAIIQRHYERADAYLFGRRTYELFAASWGAMTDAGPWEGVRRALSDRPKYVVSSTLTDASWGPATLLTGDIAAAIADLKAQPGGELQVHGSGILTQFLLEHGLVDELTLITVPVIVGQGARLFPDAGPDLALELLSTEVDSQGVTTQVFRPAGKPVYFGK